MHGSHRSASISTRVVLASGWGILCSLIIAAPVLAAHSCHRAASVAYLLFSCICHQIPERSFTLLGNPLAVCHRCSGVYIGMLIGCFVENRSMHRCAKARRYWVLGAIIPLAFDLLAPFAGLWTNTAFTRFSTGLLFGIVVSSLVIHGFTEFLQEAPWRPIQCAIDDLHLTIERRRFERMFHHHS